MSKEKQIEEMASIAYPGLDHQTVFSSIVYAQPLVNLYNAGYRKQSEGEWNDSVSAFCNKCTVCGAIVERYSVKSKGGKLNYCPNCGARMKGGE